MLEFRVSSPNEFTTFPTTQVGFFFSAEEKAGEWQMALAMFLGLTWVGRGAA